MIGLASIGVVPFFHGWELSNSKASDPETGKGRKGMTLTNENFIPDTRIPPIDTSVPTKTETATFALG